MKHSHLASKGVHFFMETNSAVPAPSVRSEGNTRFQDRAVATSFLKGLDLMTILARRPEGLPMSLIMRKLQLPRTSIFRMLTTLQHYGLVAKKGRAWCATEQFYEWSSRDTHKEIVKRYGRVIHSVAVEVDELVELGIGEAGGVRYIHWEQPRHPITIDPLKSAVYPLHQTATGKLLLSQRPDLSSGLTDRRLLSEIEDARTTGMAWNRRESDPNIMAVATWAGPPSTIAPIICIKWPVIRFTEAKAHRALAIVRRELADLKK
jgi:DNA-binding IclR family transcriptional regulator